LAKIFVTGSFPYVALRGVDPQKVGETKMNVRWRRQDDEAAVIAALLFGGVVLTGRVVLQSQ